MGFDAKSYLDDLRREVESHPGVNHLFLNRLATTPFSREDYRVFAENHLPIVGMFTTYLELLLLRAPDSEQKLWLAKVLVDEYGERSDGDDHATCYARFLEAAGGDPESVRARPIPAPAETFIEAHHRICRTRPFLEGLGAVGPGHEWAIPKMFASIIPGLRRAGFSDSEIDYFLLHTEQDQDHGAWLEEALARHATTRQRCELIRRGALASLEARQRFWTGVQNAVIRYRQPRAARPDGRAPRGNLTEILLTAWDGARWPRRLELKLAQWRDRRRPTVAQMQQATRQYVS